MPGMLSFYGRVPFTGQTVVLMCLLTLTMLMPIMSSSQGATVIDFGDEATDVLEDADHNGLAEYLVIKVKVNVYEPGAYILHGTIGGDHIAASHGPLVLEIGPHELELRFSGGDISLFGVTGHYRIELELYSTDSSLDPVVKEIFTSDIYRPQMFEAPQGTGRVSVSTDRDKVYVIGDPLTISVNQTYPQLTFFYTVDEGRGSTSSLTYTTLIAFDDSDSDGVWDPELDEKKYEADLTMVDWELDLDVKNGVVISLYGVVQLRLAGTTTFVAWAKVTFRLTSTLLLETYDSQKFDIDIDLWQPLDATHIAVLHTLRDDTGERSIEEGPEDGSDPVVHQLRVVNDRGGTQNTYSWTDEITVGYSSLSTGSEASTWYDIGDGVADIWFSYPLEGDVQVIHHDPTVGMDPENIPDVKPDEDFIRNSVLIMLCGLGLGILVVGATLYSRKVMTMKRKGGDT
ncbi:MAG: hypothetical protein JXA22_00945 [Candidatus Thermoplasmatota archaeon]|nr:hypothetical protein [Candidatus Thermoplasmatota archaeon]